MAEDSKPQLLFLGQKSTERLLEVYVKRSLSLNDTAGRRPRRRKHKWVILHENGTRLQKASSDSSAYRLARETENLILPVRRKKPSLLLRFFGLFFKRRNEAQSHTGSHTPVNGSARNQTALKKHSFHKCDLEKSNSVRSTVTVADVVRVSDELVDVEPSKDYYEKVSEELERIVKERKEGPVEVRRRSAAVAAGVQGPPTVASTPNDDIERMISLLKSHGDNINMKIKRNSSVSSFFQKLTYSTFQQLADRYVSEFPTVLPETAPTPPELVKLAFTLDFTAKVAGLSNQAVSRIMGFGNQYIQDRFTQMTSIHKQESRELEAQSVVDPD
ncbi:uncharacterized protein LOC114798677 isoform X2 [Denticeps clupeoides]|uniref:uncharacterized protein LOC114798677 isoform X2 n=1 Tax=Denticeps clupeoides TaxID=299321 RepID=UPI0010A4017A|nr:uncharacterized protein LOC114798677 isoform X2 [Denticeps clupeoides]